MGAYGWGMKQLTLASVGFDRYAKTPRRAAFLAEMERVVPWSALCALIEPFYPKPGNGRPPVGVERMLRIYFLQRPRAKRLVPQVDAAQAAA
jgi:IS5 family transposase